ncbi:MAG: trimethylamine methyltransferase family protein [Thermoleophilia bacterium]|jgi:trimethylamine--corrinoid protein Co-methyltransferase|nr:trimethylamine methyltransferase family protein [Thermoleophilia bacterium]
MARLTVSFLDETDRETLHEQTLTVLEEVGVAYNTPAALDVLEGTEAVLDRERLTARLPRELVERCLETAPGTVLLAARDPAHDVRLGDGRLSFTSDGTTTYVLDDESGELHEGTAADLGTVMRLFDALPDLDYAWATVSPRDLDPRTANLEAAAIAFRSCAKHVQTGVRGPQYVAPLLEMIAAVAGAPAAERPVFSAVNCTVAPLAHDGVPTEGSIALARAGVPLVIMPMPLMGTTAPMTVAGATVVALAELLSAVVLFQLAAPGCPLIAAPEPASADLRSGFYVSTSPDAAAAALAGVEMAKQVYGLPTLGLGMGSDAKAPDFQDGIEAPGVLDALLGADSLVGLGCFGSAEATSLATIVLHHDGVGLIRRRLADVPFDAAACLLDDIRAVGPGGHFMARPSTRRHGHDAWQPAVLRRGAFETFHGRTLVQEALERARELLATHEVKPLPDDVDRHLDEVVAAYRRHALHPA